MKIDKYDFIKLLKVENVKVVDYERIQRLFGFEYIYYHGDYYYSTRCQQCKFVMDDILEELNIVIMGG